MFSNEFDCTFCYRFNFFPASQIDNQLDMNTRSEKKPRQMTNALTVAAFSDLWCACICVYVCKNAGMPACQLESQSLKFALFFKHVFRGECK